MSQFQLTLRVGIITLCVLGLYVSYFMLRKYVMAARGELEGPSVVMSPRAKLGRVPNAQSGLFYYSLMLVLTPFLSPAHPLVMYAALAGAVAASLTSLYLAYSLLFVTRMSCVYCWVGHAVNWSLLALLIAAARAAYR